MSMVYASTYLYLPQFLNSVSYNFPSTGLLHHWLGLFLGILFFFVAIVNGIVFLISISVSSLLAYKDATEPWLVWLSELSAGLQTERLLVRFLVRAHVWVAG